MASTWRLVHIWQNVGEGSRQLRIESVDLVRNGETKDLIPNG